MIKKLTVKELELGMYVCGIEKAGATEPEFFMNNILIRTEKDLADFVKGNHKVVYVDIKEAPPVFKQEPRKEEPAEFDSFQSIEMADELTEEEPAEPQELTEDEEYSFIDTGNSNLMGLFDPLEDTETEAAPKPEQEPPASGQIEPASLFDEEDGPALEVMELEEAGAHLEPEAVPHEEETSLTIEMADPEIETEPEAAKAFEAFAEPEPIEEPEAVPHEEETSLTIEAAERLRLVEKPAEEASLPREIRDRVSFDEELQEARKVRGEAENLVRDFMGRVRIDGEVMPDRVNDTVGRMVESVFRNQDALASLSRLKSRDDYTFGHCVNVCILSLAIGRHMGLGERELNELGVGALLHDIGKMLVPEEILKKPGRLTDEELSEMQKHTSLGGEILYKTNEISEASRTVPAHHHERFDGTGYNDGLSGTDIHLYARIGAVADVYDAMTSNRVYQKGMAAEVALRRMYQNKGVLFEPVLVDRLIKCLGIYPIGTLVELNTGEMAVVCMPNHADPLNPRVLVLYDRSKRRLPGPVDVDLAADTDREITASRDPGPLAGMIEKLIA